MSLGPMEIVLICLVILLLFGAKQLPKIARSVSQTIGEFRKIGKEIEKEVEET